ncbi:MAG TPA: hypothetical protein DDX39_10115 [Bacteroidales bacterium]|nr:MAG: hypothetical protein A2W98_04350 [Bacteroidetes bacterium GWF2_33_38]OFY75465.1 MAG: hypothetical protein A2265_10445 [Bacteroidetes bacterium RIFOXYA12_FULL_33_9]OFY88406.1 MAG: hypothetical protein A2236_06190 [Bacteroidetes bacterium RIFOXYA2_FULL_33_7]HBF88983.1 hypothetical protein [Bacteroidales bacterium]
MKFFFTYLMILVLFSCVKDSSYFKIENLNNNQITILGHRGMGELYKYPGNSYEAIYPVIGIGADGTEFDVQITKDSVLVLFHDLEMSPNSTCDLTMYLHNWFEIDGCTYNTIFPNIYIITVENLFCRIPNLHELTFSFDCKIPQNMPTEFLRTFARAIKRISEKYQMTDKILIEGNEYFIKVLQEEGLQNKLFVSGTGDLNKSITLAKEMNTFGVAIDQSYVTAEDVKKAHNEGLFVMLWGAKTRPQSIKMIEKNPDIVQSDKPMYVLKIFNRFNYDYNIP